MPRTKTKARPKLRRRWDSDPTPRSYQEWGCNKISEEISGWIDDPLSAVLFVKICELLTLRRIEEITYDHDARAVLAFAAFTGPTAGMSGEWEEIYKRIDDYIEVCRTDEKRIHPMVNELRNLLATWRRQRKLQAAQKAKGGAT